MTLQQLQDAVNAWISQWDEGYWPPIVNLARLTEEVGELSREINHSHGMKKKKSGEAPSSIASELGDILFVVVSLANSLDISLDDAMRQTLEKYQVRDADRFKRRDDGGL
jgi:NTP pyrophosphatase (non-canonical NTP hydrolase)